MAQTTPDYAYESIEEYEEIVGFKVNEAFRTGWVMARVTNAHLRKLVGDSNSDTKTFSKKGDEKTVKVSQRMFLYKGLQKWMRINEE